MIVDAGAASPLLGKFANVALLVWTAGFLFFAIGLPGLVFTVGKRLIGRARPFVEGSANPLIYRPLGWNVEYASLPSGHPSRRPSTPDLPAVAAGDTSNYNDLYQS